MSNSERPGHDGAIHGWRSGGRSSRHRRAAGGMCGTSAMWFLNLKISRYFGTRANDFNSTLLARPSRSTVHHRRPPLVCKVYFHRRHPAVLATARGQTPAEIKFNNLVDTVLRYHIHGQGVHKGGQSGQGSRAFGTYDILEIKTSESQQSTNDTMGKGSSVV